MSGPNDGRMDHQLAAVAVGVAQACGDIAREMCPALTPRIIIYTDRLGNMYMAAPAASETPASVIKLLTEALDTARGG